MKKKAIVYLHGLGQIKTYEGDIRLIGSSDGHTIIIVNDKRIELINAVIIIEG